MTSARATNSTIQQLTQHFPQTGKLEAIFVRPAREVACLSLESVTALTGKGLQGDRACLTHSHKPLGSDRQVTLIQAEHLTVINALMRKTIDPSLLRRNLVVSGLNLIATKPLFEQLALQLTIGEVVFEVTGSCEPCSKMERVLGSGGYNVMRGHGGITARIIRGGQLLYGDTVVYTTRPVQADPQAQLF
ncbi:MAG: MOSC domain-containing protein [Methylophilaceae bacterium 17-44-8]|nr:MAG: MOSC domain-containing protein [Methylophilales bacterium 28-44-11]OZA05127.1 MAG: MOSC domain-containing protein [Methylophilaceae bacterium 17-44-8]